MDVRLKELIETIKTEGVKNAEETSARIIRDAEKKAGEIIAEAKTEASGIISRAHRESDQRVQAGDEALRQAGRDLILNVEKQLERVFTSLTQNQLKGAFTPAVLEETVVTLVKAWNTERVQDVTVLLSPEDLKKTEQALRAKLNDELKKGLEIKPSPSLKSGFRIGEKDGSAYYDFSGDSIAEALSAYLNPRLSALLREAARKE